MCIRDSKIVLLEVNSLYLEMAALNGLDEYEQRVTGLWRAKLSRRKFNYAKLSELLQEQYGIEESQHNLSNKIRRGKFSALFLVQVLEVIGCDGLAIETYEKR